MSSFFFSFSSGVHSRTPFHSSWLHGSVSRALLASGQVSAYLGDLALNSSSLLQSPSLSGSSLTVPLATSPLHEARGRRSRSPSLSLKPLARRPTRTQSPLVRLRPRGSTPHGSSGVDGGFLVPGGGAGVVRTRTLMVVPVLVHPVFLSVLCVF